MVVSCMAQEKQPIDQPIIYLSYSYVYMCVFLRTFREVEPRSFSII